MTVPLDEQPFPQASRLHARADDRRSPWTAVSLGASTGLLVFALLVLVGAWWRSRGSETEVPRVFPVAPSTDVVVWVGHLSPKVTALLATDWNDAGVDSRYDETLSKALDLPGAEALSFYRLQVFNTGSEPAAIPLSDGALLVKSKGGEVLGMKSLAPVLARLSARGQASAQASTLRALGAARETLDLPAQTSVSQPIAFARRFDLSDVESVTRGDGTAFHMRRMPRTQWTALVDAPSLQGLEGL